VIEPIRAGLGDRFVATFDETTPKKYLKTAVEAVRLARQEDADVLVAVGGGSSLDVAKTARALASHDESPGSVAHDAIETGNVPVSSSGTPLSLIGAPTTLAGADLSVIGGVSLTMDPENTPEHEVPNGSVSDRKLMPAALFYDLDLFTTTPKSVLCASAMNGFDKAIEALYSPHATPVTDGTAMRGIRLMQAGFPALSAESMNEQRFYQSISGVILAQYGISTPGSYKASVIHAFGHGFSHDYDAHQGTVHAIVAPHVLRYVFERIHGRRDLLAEALDVGDARMRDVESLTRSSASGMT
jgi:alcohol dehydrogenase class IV